MKAVQLIDYGLENLRVQQDVADPELKPEQIKVVNHASSVNPFDVKIASGMYKDAIPLQMPVIPGGDFAGVVTEIGEGVSDFAVGDEVYGSANILSGASGAFAEIIVAKTKNAAQKPKNISFEEAAGLVLTGASAIQALEEHIKLQAGQKVLIHGGAGGIGSLAIQIAKAIGAYVATTVSTNDVEFVKGLGADEVIDYKTEKFDEKIKDYDAVYDMVGGETVERSFEVVKQGGVIVSMVGEPNPEKGKEKSITTIGQATHVTSERLKRLRELTELGKVKVQIEKTLPLEEIGEAYQIVKEVHPRGKVVLKIS